MFHSIRTFIRAFRRLSFNQKITIVILITIPLLAVFIPIIHQNLNKPRIQIYQFQPKCDDLASQEQYLYAVHNTGSMAATNLEIRMFARSSVTINIDTAPSDASISHTPFADSQSGLKRVVIKVPNFPPHSKFQILVLHPSGAIEIDTIVTQKFLPNNVPIHISDVWYDQGHFVYEDKMVSCVPTIKAISATPPVVLTASPVPSPASHAICGNLQLKKIRPSAILENEIREYILIGSGFCDDTTITISTEAFVGNDPNAKSNGQPIKVSDDGTWMNVYMKPVSSPSQNGVYVKVQNPDGKSASLYVDFQR